MFWSKADCARLMIATLILFLTGCGITGATTGASPAQDIQSADAPKRAEAAADRAEVEKVARQYAEAKGARNFGAIWDLLAAPSQRHTLSLSKAPAEKDDVRAKAQGFESSAQVAKLVARSYFKLRRERLADKGKYVYASGADVVSQSIGNPVTVPIAGARLRVFPANIRLSDGSSDTVGVTLHAGRYSIVEP